jgi:hypothetical protein
MKPEVNSRDRVFHRQSAVSPSASVTQKETLCKERTHAMLEPDVLHIASKVSPTDGLSTMMTFSKDLDCSWDRPNFVHNGRNAGLAQVVLF